MYNNFRFLIFLIILGIFCGCQNNTNYKIPINIESIDDDKPVFGPERPPKKTNSSN